MFAGCNILGENSGKDETSEGTSVSMTVSGAKEGYGVISLAGTAGAMDPEVCVNVDESTPQIICVTNESGDVVMMTREIVRSSSSLSIDCRSTALALVTMNPLFAGVRETKYFGMLQEMIVSASGFNTLEQEVEKSVSRGRCIFDSSNSGLITAYGNLMDELEDGSFSAPATRGTKISNINSGPFKVEMSGSRLQISNYGLTPMYEGTVLYNGEEIAQIDIPAGEDYGITSAVFRDDIMYGKPVTFDFGGREPGTYEFFFDRNTEAALADFAVNYFCNVLDIAGATVSALQASGVRQALVQWSMQRGVSYMGMILNDKYSVSEKCEFTMNALMDFISSDAFTACCSAASAAAVSALVKKLSPFATFYSLVRGSSNAMARLYMRVSSPANVIFVLEYDGNNVKADESVCVRPVSGDRQAGDAFEWLKLPVRARVVKMNDVGANQYILTFTVVSGGGSVSKTAVCTDENLEGETYWELGDECDFQELRVDVLDIATHTVISDPSYNFIAVCNNASGSGGSGDSGDVTEGEALPSWLTGTWCYTYNGKTTTIELSPHSASLTNDDYPSDNFSGKNVYFDGDVSYGFGKVCFSKLEDCIGGSEMYRTFLDISGHAITAKEEILNVTSYYIHQNGPSKGQFIKK